MRYPNGATMHCENLMTLAQLQVPQADPQAASYRLTPLRIMHPVSYVTISAVSAVSAVSYE